MYVYSVIVIKRTQRIVYPICVQIHHGTSSQGGLCKCAQSLCHYESGIKNILSLLNGGVVLLYQH